MMGDEVDVDDLDALLDEAINKVGIVTQEWHASSTRNTKHKSAIMILPAQKVKYTFFVL
jgi:hypothetical protein